MKPEDAYKDGIEPVIGNFDDIVNKGKKSKKRPPKNAPFLPSYPLMGIIVAKTGSGKTNNLMWMIAGDGNGKPPMIYWDKIMLYSKTLDQDKYAWLIQNVKAVERKTKQQIGIFTDQESELPTPEQLDPKFKHLLILDDVLEEKQGNLMSRYFTRGRHVNCDVIFCSQSFFDMKKGAIRQNATYLQLFKGISPGDIQNIARLYAPDVSVKEFKRFYDIGTQEDHSFVSVLLNKSIKNGAYRHGFTKVVDPRSL